MSIIVNDEETYQSEDQSDREKRLVRWVMDRVDSWRQHRDDNFKEKWDEYYRLWRGIWQESDKNRKSERSRIVAPALQQAIEATVAEFEEATFSRKNWIDIEDDVLDEQKQDVTQLRDRFIEDLELAGVPYAVAETFLNGALYGTGISKIIVEDRVTKSLVDVPVPNTVDLKKLEVKETESVIVKLVPVADDDFVIDPTATWPDGIDDCLGCAHEYFTQRYKIEAGMNDEYYKNVTLADSTDIRDYTSRGEQKPKDTSDQVKICEYTGLVPESLLKLSVGPDEEVVSIVEKEEEQVEPDYYRTGKMVEALVTIANGSILLKEAKNPYLMNDRPFIGYPHDLVPGRFWGRGTAEKGYNPQKALDAELRMRLDALALTSHPMMGIDATRLPRGFRFSVGPGKNLLSNGDPRQTYFPISFQGGNPGTYREAAELERMIQVGTGAIDSATSISGNARNSTASGMSMMLSGMIKRSKRTMANINRLYLERGLKKMLWRYMQFRPDRYPVSDYTFKVKSSLGIMAREVEQTQFVNLLSVTPPNSPMFTLMVKGIFDNSSLANKEELMAIADQLLQSQMNPQQDPAVDQLKKLELALKEAKVEETASKAILNVAKAEGEESGSQINTYMAIVEALNGTGNTGTNEPQNVNDGTPGMGGAGF